MSELQKQIATGTLAARGLMGDDDAAKAAALVTKAREMGLETIRVLFADQHGVLRGKTMVAEALPSVLADGLAAPSTLILKDTSHRTAFPVWSAAGDVAGGLRGAGDLLMVPDAGTFRALPWSPKSAWLICDLAFASGEPLPFCTRSILRQAVAQLEKRGMALVVGLEVEFHVFRIIDPRLDHGAASMPGMPVQTENTAQGYQFLTDLRYDAMEPIIDKLRSSCQALGLPLRSMEVEMGPSQIEFTFDPADPMTHADNMVMLRTAVKEVCQREGLHATFMCKPQVENTAASGWHLHQSLVDAKSGQNTFLPEGPGLTDTCAHWLSGLLKHAAEGSLLSTPTVNGYKRYQPHQLAPDRIVWGRDNRGAMIRDLTREGDPASRIENRVAEPTANPFLFFASQIIAGLAGIDAGEDPPLPVEDPYDEAAPALPSSLAEAIDAFDQSALFRSALGDAFVDYLCQIKRMEWQRYHQTVSAWEQQEYFNLF